MPKKAAEPKAPAAAKPAAEKPAAAAASKAPAAEKAPQAKSTDAGAKQHEGAKQHDGAKKHDDGGKRQDGAKKFDGPKSGGNAYQGKSDPAIDKINARIENIKAEIKKCQDEVSSLDKKIEAKKADKVNINSDKSELQAKLTELKNAIADANKEKQIEHEKADEVHRLREIKILQSQKMRDAFPGKAPGPGTSDDYLKNLDDEIKKKELLHASKSHSLPEEKKLLAEITSLQQGKKQFKEYKALQTEIAEDLQRRKDFNTAAKAKGDIVTALKAQQKALQDSNSSALGKIQASRSEVDDLYSRRAQERDKIAKLRAEQDTEWQQIRVLRDQKREQYAKKKEEQAIRNKEYNERKREKLEAQKKLEDAREPYEDELSTCDYVLGYLQTFVKKEEDKSAESTSDTSSPAAPLRSNAPVGTALKKEKEEDGPLKQKKQARKKAPAVTDNINHDISVFGYFETISLSPPNKISEVEATIGQVEAKKEHFKKLAAEQVEARKVRREREAKELEEKQKAEAEQAANTTTTTTTTTEETPAEVQVA